MIKIEVAAANADELRLMLCALTGAVDIATMPTEAILHVLCDRLAADGKVVKVESVMPADGGPEANASMTDPPARRMRRTKANNPDATPPVANIKDGPSIAMATDNAAAQQVAPEHSAPTRADVIAALDQYSTKHKEGQAGARVLMEKVTGTASLKDVKESQYTALIQALAA